MHLIFYFFLYFTAKVTFQTQKYPPPYKVKLFCCQPQGNLQFHSCGPERGPESIVVCITETNDASGTAEGRNLIFTFILCLPPSQRYLDFQKFIIAFVAWGSLFYTTSPVVRKRLNCKRQWQDTELGLVKVLHW